MFEKIYFVQYIILKKTPIITRKFDFKLTRKLESLHFISQMILV